MDPLPQIVQRNQEIIHSQ
jgi:hypothetical protein